MCISGLPLISQTDNTSKLDVNLSAGTVFPGKIEAAWHLDFKPGETVTFHNAHCMLIKASADYALLKNISVGFCSNYVPIQIQNTQKLGISDKTIHMCEIDGTLKYRLFLTNNVLIRPGISFGYRHTFSEEPDARENGVCLNMGTDCVFNFGDKYFLLGDFGVFTQPFGGVADVAYVRTWSVFYTNIGFGFRL
jgi:hypothetical protein